MTAKSKPETPATLAAPSGLAWTRDLPTESGAYWWWNEDEDSAPIHIEIMYSGSDGSYFAPAGQYGWNCFQSVAEMGGWWMRLHEPETPNEKPSHGMKRMEPLT